MVTSTSEVEIFWNEILNSKNVSSLVRDVCSELARGGRISVVIRPQIGHLYRIYLSLEPGDESGISNEDFLEGLFRVIIANCDEVRVIAERL